ncbi:MAG: hypothetical protein M3Z17_10580 [Gemmatimonadota bacterium]|nr:hypothetical protein [Gemmatimonadota bacterium]
MSEIDYPEDFIPIAAEIQRLPYLSPSAKFADRVMSRVRIQGAEAPLAVVAPPRLSVIQGGARHHVPDSALVKSRRRQLMRVAVGVPATVGVLFAVSILFAQLDVLSVLLGAAGAELGTVIGIAGATTGNYFLGSDVMTALQAGSAQSALVYMVMVLGLVAGYSGIKVAAEIAKRKAA